LPSIEDRSVIAALSAGTISGFRSETVTVDDVLLRYIPGSAVSPTANLFWG
jgi:hypothetical protein